LGDVGFGSVRLWGWRKIDYVDFDDLSQAHQLHMDKDKGMVVSLNLEALKQ